MRTVLIKRRSSILGRVADFMVVLAVVVGVLAPLTAIAHFYLSSIGM